MRMIWWVRGIYFISVSEGTTALALFRRGTTHRNVPRSLQWIKTNKTETGSNSVSKLFGKAMRLFRDGGFADNVDAGMSGYTEITDEFGRGALEKTLPDGNNKDEGRMQFIRLEKEPDSSALKDFVTREDVMRKIHQVRQEQSRYGCADLYPRTWESSILTEERVNGDCSMKVSELSNGCTMPKADNVDNSVATFSVMQFNALAEGLSSGPNHSKPFSVDSDGAVSKEDSKKGFGGFTSLPHPSMVLDFGRRKWRLLEVLVGSHGDAPFDLIALEEIDRYRGFFEPLLRIFGYDGLFVPKPNSPGVRMGWYSDGCALVWKRHVFDLLWQHGDAYTVGNQVFVTAVLRHRATDQIIVVAVTHLKAQRSEANEWTRCRQVEELVAAVDAQVSRVQTECHQSDVPIILLGDFNADPPSVTQGFKESAVEHLLAHDLRAGESSETTAQQNGNGARYQSAYPLDDLKGEFYTSWKIRGSTATKRVIDYIFYHGRREGTWTQLQCVATLHVPSGDQLEPSKLPGLRYPSDHLHLGARFVIRSPITRNS